MGIANSKAGLQRRAVRAHEWTKKKRAIFLQVLGDTCNVSLAARSAGMSNTNAYGLKKRDGEFAALWHDAFVAGRERLHEHLIAHSLGQIPTGDNPDEASLPASGHVPVAFDPVRAIAVLKLQGGFDGGRKGSSGTVSQGDVDAALMARLEEMATRLAKRAGA